MQYVLTEQDWLSISKSQFVRYSLWAQCCTICAINYCVHAWSYSAHRINACVLYCTFSSINHQASKTSLNNIFSSWLVWCWIKFSHLRHWQLSLKVKYTRYESHLVCDCSHSQHLKPCPEFCFEFQIQATAAPGGERWGTELCSPASA